MKRNLFLLALLVIFLGVTAQRGELKVRGVSTKEQIYKEIQTILQSARYSNNEATWMNVKSKISDYLIQKWKEGSLKGTTSAQAFYIIVDRRTMTQSDIDSGRIIVDVGLALVKPAEFEMLTVKRF